MTLHINTNIPTVPTRPDTTYHITLSVVSIPVDEADRPLGLRLRLEFLCEELKLCGDTQSKRVYVKFSSPNLHRVVGLLMNREGEFDVELSELEGKTTVLTIRAPESFVGEWDPIRKLIPHLKQLGLYDENF